MDLFIFIISSIVFFYSLMILSFIAGFYKVPDETYKTDIAVNNFSVIVPFRNEESSLEMLIESLNDIEYPRNKFEIIFVNDNSDDNSLILVNKLLKTTTLDYTILSLDSSLNGKKEALTFGISKAKNPWILTTDADCIVMPLWLKLFDQKLNDNDVKMLAGAVNFITNGSGFIEAFQTLDLSALIGTSIGSFGIGFPMMCNGANLLFSKDAFYEVSGYEGNIDIASGDDMFLMEKFKKHYPNKLGYLKARGAVVLTHSVSEIDEFINQRVRWAAKSSKYGSDYLKFISVLVGLANISLIILFFLAIFGVSLSKILPIISLKIFVNFWMIKITSSFLDNKRKLYYYPIVSILYPFYIIGISILSQFSSFEWKGRIHKK